MLAAYGRADPPARPPNRRKPPKTRVYAFTDPLEVGLRQTQVVLDRGQRDGSCRVQHDHELCEADEDEDQPGVSRGVVGASSRGRLIIRLSLATATPGNFGCSLICPPRRCSVQAFFQVPGGSFLMIRRSRSEQKRSIRRLDRFELKRDCGQILT